MIICAPTQLAFLVALRERGKVQIKNQRNDLSSDVWNVQCPIDSVV